MGSLTIHRRDERSGVLVRLLKEWIKVRTEFHRRPIEGGFEWITVRRGEGADTSPQRWTDRDRMWVPLDPTLEIFPGKEYYVRFVLQWSWPRLHKDVFLVLIICFFFLVSYSLPVRLTFRREVYLYVKRRLENTRRGTSFVSVLIWLLKHCFRFQTRRSSHFCRVLLPVSGFPDSSVFFGI